MNSNPILRFLIFFLLAYGTIIVLYPVFKIPERNYVAKIGNTFLRSPIKNSLVQIQKKQSKFDIEIGVGNESKLVGDSIKMFPYFISTYEFIYIPFAILLALVIASPISIKRKFLSLIISGFFFHLLILIKLYLIIVEIATQNIELELLELTSWKRNVFDWLIMVFINYPPTSFFTVVFIWLGVTFRKEDMSIIRIKSPAFRNQ